MVLKKELFLKTVVDGLSILRTSCESRGKLGLTDLHHLAESFFCPFLNEAYRLNLKVLESGHPAIDLADAKARVAFQISSDNSKAKMQNTLDTYSAKKLFSTYPSVKILIGSVVPLVTTGAMAAWWLTALSQPASCLWKPATLYASRESQNSKPTPRIRTLFPRRDV
jgi:hypothetical protein